MLRAAKLRETAHRIREVAKLVHEDDRKLEVLLNLADDCDAQADDLEKVETKKVEVDIVAKYGKYGATSAAHRHRHHRRHSTRR